MTNDILLEKIDLVVNRLMNLGGADYDSDKMTDRAQLSKGIIARDFGIEEWDWPQGVGLYGLSQLQTFYGDGRYLDFLKAWFARNVRQGLPSRNINTTAPYLALISNLDAMGEPAYDEMCRAQAQWLMDGLPKTQEGGFQHVTSALGDRDGVDLHDGEVWVDTLFMAVLFLSLAGRRYNQPAWTEEAIHQMLLHIKYLYDKKTGLFHHGWSFNDRSNFGGVFWGRGNSWFTLGVNDFIDSFQGRLSPGIHRYLADTLRAQVDALMKLQAPSGLWHTILDDPGSYEEASGTAAIVAGIIKGIRSGVLDAACQPCADRAIAALCGCVAADGTVEKVSAGTGIGSGPQHYRDIAIMPMAYGQSLALIALTTALQ